MAAPALYRQEYWTARELAGLVVERGLSGLPTSAFRIRAKAEREGWAELPGKLVRQRPPEQVGGRPSTEYHV